MAPGIASGGSIGVGGAFLLNSKTEKPMEPLSRTIPPSPLSPLSQSQRKEVGRHLRPPASPPGRTRDTTYVVPHPRLLRTRLSTWLMRVHSSDGVL